MLGQVQSDIIGIYFHENVTSHNEFDNTGVDDLVDTLGHGNNCCVGEASLGKNGYGISLSYSVFGGGGAVKSINGSRQNPTASKDDT